MNEELKSITARAYTYLEPSIQGDWARRRSALRDAGIPETLIGAGVPTITFIGAQRSAQEIIQGQQAALDKISLAIPKLEAAQTGFEDFWKKFEESLEPKEGAGGLPKIDLGSIFEGLGGALPWIAIIVIGILLLPMLFKGD